MAKAVAGSASRSFDETLLENNPLTAGERFPGERGMRPNFNKEVAANCSVNIRTKDTTFS